MDNLSGAPFGTGFCACRHRAAARLAASRFNPSPVSSLHWFALGLAVGTALTALWSAFA